MDLLGPCTNVFLTAYAHVRTEPQCDIGQTRGKKNRTWLVSTLEITKDSGRVTRTRPSGPLDKLLKTASAFSGVFKA